VVRTFGLTVYGTVTAATEEEALDLVEHLLPGSVGIDITLDDVEVTAQHCVGCWCLTDADSQRCAECESAPAGDMSQAV
jgi:hypothetical protein